MVSVFKRSKRAFTLLELIVTLVIIALLASIAIPTFVRVQSKAESETARTEVAATLRNALALSAFDTPGSLDLETVTQAAKEVALGAKDPSPSGERNWQVVSAPEPSKTYGQLSFSTKGSVTSVAMLSRSGECVMGRVEGTNMPQTWIAPNGLCIADPDAAAGEAPGVNPDEEVDDPTKPPVSEFDVLAEDARVTLSWLPLPGTTGYNVYRNGILVLAVPSSASGEKVTYVDLQVTNGVEYTYTVAAYDNRGTWEKAPELKAKDRKSTRLNSSHWE